MSQPLPPGPRRPAVVQLVQLSSDPHGFLARCRARFGDLWTLRLPGQPPVVLVSDPEGVRQLVTAGYDDILRRADGVRFILGDHSVIFQQDEQHRETRRIMLPPFHGERMRAYGSDMAQIADETIGHFRAGDRRLLHKEMQDVTLKVILRCVFGITEERRIGELGRLIVEYVDAVMKPWFYGATLLLSPQRVRDFLRARGARMRRGDRAVSRWPVQSVADRLGAIDAILFDEIARCRALSDEARGRRADILSLLVAARYEDGSPLPDDALRDHLMTLLIGGHETTATSICWAIDCALRHPGTIEKMRAEVENVLGDGFDSSRVKQLTYIGAVINESMRLYPIAWGVGRELKHDVTFAGQRLSAGTMVAPAIFLTQRDPRVWEDPTAFRPERFLGGKASVYHFFPFGAGVWRCLGAQFAEYEMRVVLARLVTEVDLQLDPSVGIRPLMRGFTIAPSEGMPVRVVGRRTAATALPRTA